jgi:hypothetical protein
LKEGEKRSKKARSAVTKAEREILQPKRGGDLMLINWGGYKKK